MPAFARPRSEAPARIDRQLLGDEFRAANVADGSKASVRGSRERSLGLEVLAAASISRKVGMNDRFMCGAVGHRSGAQMTALLPLPTFAREI